MYTFPKKEHLCGNKNIENLYTNGKSFLIYPLRIVYLQIEKEEVPVRVMVSVSKKKFKRAVKRNRIKRLIRETYRLNKNELIAYAEQNDIKLHIAFQYIAAEIETFQKLNEKMQTALKKIEQNSQKHENAEENS
ncbi:Ribonuclease P protein component [uncultured Paludibacter sp.]|nr:Ribonuclease P protein component [uncultured Paludibacter sp.]